jgi:SNF2 family DNA or RNA helicase
MSLEIVFTTYQTLEKEHRSKGRNSDSLFSYHWKRVILDEGK